MNIDLPLYQVRSDEINLSANELKLFNDLLAVWQNKLGSNVRNNAYYEGKLKLAGSDSNSPDELKRLHVVMGWGGKCVNVLASRSVLSGFEGNSSDEFMKAIGDIDLKSLYKQAVRSELTNSCSFISISKGLEGEPDVIVSAHSALDAAAVYNYRKKRIKAALVVLDINEMPDGQRLPTWVVMYTDNYTYNFKYSEATKKWHSEKAENPLGRPLIEPLVYNPHLTRPFGQSRITKTIRSLIDRALCVGARMETSAVFYTWPQRYLLNVDKRTAEKMADTKLGMYVDRVLLISTNKNGDSPQYGQLPQMTMQPHIDHFENLAKQFASEACLPLDEVGVVFDNPTSAEAMESAQKRLIVEAEDINRANGAALRNIALMSLACSRNKNLQDLSDEDRDLFVNFENPLRPSAAARADYSIKVASAVPEYPLTDQFWIDLGYSKDQIAVIKDQIEKASTQMALTQAAAQLAATPITLGGSSE